MASIEKVRELFEAAQFMPLLETMFEDQFAAEQSSSAKKGDKEGMMLAEVKHRLQKMYIQKLLVLVQRHMQDHLSDEELDVLIDFYHSELYKKYISLLPGFWGILQSSSGSIGMLIKENAETVAKQVAEEYQIIPRTASMQ